MKVGVTGGLGLLGRAVVLELIDRGHTPVVIDRAVAGAADTDRVEGIDHRQADIRSLGETSASLAGLDAVVHTASLIDLHLGRPDALHDVNVIGARNVVAACRTNGIGRLVHMSSAEVVTGTYPLRGLTEANARYPEEQLTYYGETKQHGEEIVLAGADDDLGTCAMRTYGLFGVGDNTVVPIFLRTLPGRSIVHIGDQTNKTDVVFAPNLAHCMVLAVEQLEPGIEWSGSVFHVTDNDPVNIQRFLADLVAPLGYRVVDRFRLPRPVAAALAQSYEARYRLTGSERFARPPLSDHKLRLAVDDYWLDSSRASGVLGYEPKVIRAEAVDRTREWLLASADRINAGKR